MPTRRPLRHHRAKMEYRDLEEKIFLMLSKGYSRRLIHEELTEKKEMSMAYLTLCQFIRNAKKKGTAPAMPAAKAKTPSVTPLSGPRHITPSSNKFPDPRDMNPDDAL